MTMLFGFVILGAEKGLGKSSQNGLPYLHRLCSPVKLAKIQENIEMTTGYFQIVNQISRRGGGCPRNL